MVEARVEPRGPYSLKLTTWTAEWRSALPGGRWAEARQSPNGTVIVRASSEQAVAEARFMLALDDDTSEFHWRFASDPLLGRSVRMLRGLRPKRMATVAHAVLHAVCGQLIQSRRARDIERAVTRACGVNPPSQRALAALSPARVTACGLAPSRAATLARIVRTIDLEALKTAPDMALMRLRRERGFGPWSTGVVALGGLGRYDRAWSPTSGS